MNNQVLEGRIIIFVHGVIECELDNTVAISCALCKMHYIETVIYNVLVYNILS